jgi:V/A-type H+/Na+-transporting ATPase subunit F
MDKYQIAILGNRDAILGFKGLGVAALGLSPDTATAVLKESVECGRFAIIFITEDWAEILEKNIQEYKELALPAIVIVPSTGGSTGIAFKNLKKIVEQAVGSDILFKDGA